MGDPQRLLASARAGGLTRALLESAGPATVGPTREQVEAVWGSLAARTAAVPVGPKPGRAPGASGAASVAGPIAAIGGVTLAAAIALVVALHGRSASPRSAPPAPTPTEPAPTAQPPAPTPTEPAPTAQPAAAQAPAAPASTAPAPPPGSAPPPASRPLATAPRPVQPDPGSSLRVESELLLRARASLRAGDCVAALTQAERLKARFPAGALAQEREVVAIQALACEGRDAEASARASAFLQEHPASPHADAVRALVE